MAGRNSANRVNVGKRAEFNVKKIKSAKALHAQSKKVCYNGSIKNCLHGSSYLTLHTKPLPRDCEGGFVLGEIEEVNRGETEQVRNPRCAAID